MDNLKFQPKCHGIPMNLRGVTWSDFHCRKIHLIEMDWRRGERSNEELFKKPFKKLLQKSRCTNACGLVLTLKGETCGSRINFGVRMVFGDGMHQQWLLASSRTLNEWNKMCWASENSGIAYLGCY